VPATATHDRPARGRHVPRPARPAGQGAVAVGRGCRAGTGR
jgi:hypothetical protein